MSFLDFAATYFTSQPAVVTLAVLFSTLVALSVLFRFEEYRPQRRLRILFASFALEVLAWSFLASSLILCRAFLGLYQTSGELATVRIVFSLAVLSSLAIALPLSAFVTFKVPVAIARRLAHELPEPDGEVVDIARRTSRRLGVVFLRLLQAPSGVPFAYSVGGGEGVIVVSKGLVASLDEDEMETVLAHELVHVKHHDTGVSTVLAVYRKVLFFDPFIRLLERAIYSEKEFSADELSARETQKPLSLASALLKIGSAQSSVPGSPANMVGLSILGRGENVKPPAIKERIERLLRLATEIEPGAVPQESMPRSG